MVGGRIAVNIFDIIGPVMIGPSSSHTAGAARIGRVTRKLLSEQPCDILVRFHGSFAGTYKGHGTAKAIIAGLMDMPPDDVRIRESLAIAGGQNIKYRFESAEMKGAHPNTVLIEAAGPSGKTVRVVGSSVGGGNIVIKRINDMEVEFTCQFNTLVIMNTDVPGTIAAVSGLLAENGVNIAQMKVFRTRRGGEAIMIIEADQRIEADLPGLIAELPCITDVKSIEAIG